MILLPIFPTLISRDANDYICSIKLNKTLLLYMVLSQLKLTFKLLLCLKKGQKIGKGRVTIAMFI
jgi:hypothetical protein